jgi:hypothetical protein
LNETAQATAQQYVEIRGGVASAVYACRKRLQLVGNCYIREKEIDARGVGKRSKYLMLVRVVAHQFAEGGRQTMRYLAVVFSSIFYLRLS